MNALELQGLTKHYKDFTLGPLDLTLPGGTICGLIGENGAGKSTTIRLILDMVQRDGGTVTILGRDSRTASVRAKEEIGVVLGSDGIPLCLNAVEVGKVMAGIYRNWDAGDYTAFCRKFDLPPDKKYKDYSAGMQRKLCIAVALAHHPKLLLLDEATNGLDPAGIQEMRSLIASMPQTTGATVLISSHLLGEIEQMVDQVGILNHGKLLFEGSLQQLQKHSRGGILLRVLDAPKAAAVLQQQGVKAAAPADQPDTLQLPPLPDEALAALVCTLAESGVGVVGLTAQTKSLEDIFLSLTQTSGEVA